MSARKRKYVSWRFVVDFAGGDLGMIGKNVKVEPVITASRGRRDHLRTPARLGSGLPRNVRFEASDFSLAPVDLRLYLRADGQPLTETWLTVNSTRAAPMTARRLLSPVHVMLLDRQASKSEASLLATPYESILWNIAVQNLILHFLIQNTACNRPG